MAHSALVVDGRYARARAPSVSRRFYFLSEMLQLSFYARSSTGAIAGVRRTVALATRQGVEGRVGPRGLGLLQSVFRSKTSSVGLIHYFAAPHLGTCAVLREAALGRSGSAVSICREPGGRKKFSCSHPPTLIHGSRGVRACSRLTFALGGQSTPRQGAHALLCMSHIGVIHVCVDE